MKKKNKKALSDEEGGNPLVKKRKSAAFLSYYDLMEAILQRLQEVATKDGQEIEFEFIENDPEDKKSVNVGWVVHRLNALVGGENVGVLKISYIPLERFYEIFPTIWHFMGLIKGWAGLRDILKSGEYKDPEILWKIAAPYIGILNPKKDYSLEQKLKDLKRTEDRYSEKFRLFKRHWVNKPMVDYIKVEEPWNRKGVGQSLYQKGSEIMRKRGMKLHASGLQSPEAKAVWRKMGFGHKSGRRFVNESSLLADFLKEALIKTFFIMEPTICRKKDFH